MTGRTTLLLPLSFAIALLLGGCAGAVRGTGPVAPSNDDPNYRAGYRDGCATAHGEYTKESELFRNDKHYYDGWFAGRSACQYR
jgi:hypothetical protein